MPGYGPGVLDILARAYDHALELLPLDFDTDLETARAVLLQGILDAARVGERDEKALVDAGLNRIARFDASGLETTATLTRSMPLGL